jgi:hypothetical protein
MDDIVFVSCDERLRGGIFLDEFEEDRDGVFTVGADEESDGDEKAEGIKGELFLDESEVRRGEGREVRERLGVCCEEAGVSGDVEEERFLGGVGESCDSLSIVGTESRTLEVLEGVK